MTIEEAGILVYGHKKNDPDYPEALAMVIEVDKRIAANILPKSYIDRGDAASWDFSKADFIIDGDWHVLDLSGIVPEGTSLIHLSIVAQSAYNDKVIKFCKCGNVNNFNKELIGIQHGNKEYYESRFIACDVDGKIEYWISSGYWPVLDVLIRGWFKQ